MRRLFVPFPLVFCFCLKLSVYLFRCLFISVLLKAVHKLCTIRKVVNHLRLVYNECTQLRILLLNSQGIRPPSIVKYLAVEGIAVSNVAKF